MTTDRKVLTKMILHALSGKGAHVAAKEAVAGLDWKLSGVQPEGVSHSIFQLLNHMIYWNKWAVKWLAGQKPAVPKHALGSWPGKTAPDNSAEWRSALRQFDEGLREMTHATGTQTCLRSAELRRRWQCCKRSPCTTAIISDRWLCYGKGCALGRLHQVASLGSRNSEA